MKKKYNTNINDSFLLVVARLFREIEKSKIDEKAKEEDCSNKK
jgi:hypothetical protein